MLICYLNNTIAMKLIFHLVVGALASLIASVEATDYFVKNGGDDTASGVSFEQAWKSLDRANTARLAPGDRLYLAAGEIFTGQLTLRGESTAEGGLPPIEVRTFGPGRANVHSPEGSALVFENLGGIVVEDLIITGSGVPNMTTVGVHFRNSLTDDIKLANIRVSGLDVSGFGRAGILIEGAAPDRSRSGFENVEILNTVVHHNFRSGLEFTGVYDGPHPGMCHRHVVVRHCIAHHNSGHPEMRTHSGSGIIIADVQDGLVEGCEAYENGALCQAPKGGPVGIWAVVSDRITFRHCLSHHNRTNTLDGGGFDFDIGITNSLMEDCLSHDNDGPGFLLYTQGTAPRLFENNTVRQCISRNDGQKNDYGGFYIGHHLNPDGVRNIVIEDCRVEITATGVPNRAAITIFGAQGVHFARNQIITTGGVWFVNTYDKREAMSFDDNRFTATDDTWRLSWAGEIIENMQRWVEALAGEEPKKQDSGN